MSESSQTDRDQESSPNYEDYEAVFIDADGNPRTQTEALSKGGGDWDEDDQE